jgi:hypothetical protein
MSSKQKTSVRAGAKATNKNSTDKVRKAVSAEIAERIERLDAAEAATTALDAPDTKPAKGKGRKAKAAPDAATVTAYADDGTLQTVSIPADEPAPETAKPARSGRKPKAAKQPKPEKVKKVSGLDAAALVLAESATPMKAVDMLAEIQKRGLWASKGRTPEATLYAAIIREIAAKGKDSRFKKHDRGLFIATGKEG